MKIAYLMFFLVFVSACSAPQKQYVKHIASTTPISPDATFYFHDMPAPSNFVFRGELDLSEMDDDAYGMVYPADGGVVGVLVGIAAHAIVENQKQNSQAAEALSIANRMLSPIRPKINGINSAEAVSQALANQRHKLTNSNNGFDESEAWLLEFKPMFYISQDYSTLRLKNVVSIYSPFDDNKTEVYRNLIEAVRLMPKDFKDDSIEEGVSDMQLLTESLLSETITLALDDATNNLKDNQDFQTFKFYEGGKVNYSRGRLVNVACSTLVFRTLRNWIKSIPMSLNRDATLAEDCTDLPDSETLALNEKELSAFSTE
ncbi:MAG: hypothetical protein ACMZ64_01410 [Oleiphilus sp.]